jgi:hypothetical protein
VVLAGGEEEGCVALEVCADGGGNEFAVKGEAEHVAGAGGGFGRHKGVRVWVEVVVPLGVAGDVGFV